MEGRLIGGILYIEIAPDYSDLEKKLEFYMAHIPEAEAIVAHANAYCRQFFNPFVEELCSRTFLLVSTSAIEPDSNLCEDGKSLLADWNQIRSCRR